MQKDISGLDDQMMDYNFGIAAIEYALSQLPPGWFSDRASPQHEAYHCGDHPEPLHCRYLGCVYGNQFAGRAFFYDVGTSVAQPNVN